MDQSQASAGEGRAGPLTSLPILLYDGVCGLCNRSVQFILRHDRSAIFRFASLQSSFAAGILSRHGADPADLDTVYVLAPAGEEKLDRKALQGTAARDTKSSYSPELQDRPPEVLLARSDAVIFVLRQLGGVWQALAVLLWLIPRPLRDWGYGVVAHYRYRIFGRYDSCPVPSAETRARFLDQ